MARIPIDLKKMPVSLTVEQYEWLRKKAFDHRIPMSQVIREILEKERLQDNPQGKLV